VCSGQNLTLFKIVTHVPHLPTLQITIELSSKVHVIPDLLKIFSSQGSLFSDDFSSESSSSSNRSPLISADSYAVLFSSIFLTYNIPQRWQLWIMVYFSACYSYKVAPLIVAFTTSRHVQIVQLQRSHMYLSTSMPTAQSNISRPSTLTKRRREF